MKALTLYQPWATLIAIGPKKIETRSWPTKYRGTIAIHAGLNKRYCGMKSKDYICGNEPFNDVLLAAEDLLRYPPNFMPLGAVIAICDIEGCWQIKPGPLNLSDQEKAFGDYTPGRYMWMLNNVTAVKPVFVKGSMGLWEWEGL